MFPLVSNHPFELFDLTASDVVIVVLMILVFTIALFLPRPRRRQRRGERP